MWNFDLEEEPLRHRDHNTFTADNSQRRAQFGLTSDLVLSSSSPPTTLKTAVNRLFVLQVIIAMALKFPHDDLDKEKIFFSSLDSVNTIVDGILRKLRGLLMVVSLDHTKFELMEDENVANKTKVKQAASQRKKKGKNRSARNFNSALKNCSDDFAVDKALEVFLFL